MNAWLVVLAGGTGTRFWPRSRAMRPKQLLSLVGDEALLNVTLKRFKSWIPADHCVVLTTKQLEQPVKESIKNIEGVSVLCEPEGRNTAPCIVMAMEWIRAKDPKALVVFVPADHWITETSEYIQTMKLAAKAADERKMLVTVGIQPTRPETGFGYIKSGNLISDSAYEVKRFVEKPSKEVAETMVQSPEYLWNAGMFVWSTEVFFSELEKYGVEFLQPFQSYREALARGETGEKELLLDYAKSSAISIDYALLEKSKNVAVVPGGNFGWNDLGSFVAFDEVYEKSEGGVARAKNVISIDSVANIIDCPGKTVALLGVTDMVIVDTGDVILVATKDRAQEVKKFVDRLKFEGKKDLI